MGKIRIFGLDSRRVGKLLSMGDEDSSVPPSSPPSENPCAEDGRNVRDAIASIGRYKLVQVLGEGGMGIVYLAEQEHPIRRQVALKIIKPGMDSKRVIARFQSEQQALALMEHPYIARVYDAGLTENGRPYFVMEHVQGVPITAHCDQHRLTIEERLHLFLRVCEAVQHAHQKGIVHRDLKPSNILVAIQDKEAVPKVIDFGVARAMDEPLAGRTLFTEQGQLIGTPEYMSPEQADVGAQDIDTRTDIYSLGVILYELLAGVLPFDPKAFREGGIERIRKILCEEEPKTPSTRLSKTSAEESTESAQRRGTDVRTLQRKLSGDLDWIVLKAMEKDRTRRYATVDALATDIRNYLTHQPVAAAPPGTLYRARKFARRHGQALAALAMTILLLIGGLLTTILYVRIMKERTRVQSLEHQRMLEDARMLTGSGKYVEALARLGPLLDSQHVGRETRLVRARLLLEQKDLAAATTELETLLDQEDKIAGQAHFLLASIYYEDDPWSPGRAEEYRAKWQFHSQQAQKLLADTAEYRFLQAKDTTDVKEKLRLLGEALRLERNHYGSLRDRAYIHYAQGDYDRMILDAISMKAARPEDPQGYLLGAIALRELCRLGEAIAYHEEAVSLAPQDASVYEERRETYLRMGEHSLALADAQRSAELEPNNLSYQARVFVTLVALGRYEQADRQFEQTMRRPWANAEYSPWAWELGSWSPKDWFRLNVSRCVSEALSRNQPLGLPAGVPGNIGFWALREAVDYHDRLSRHARRVVAHGWSPSWSPDGTQIAYSQGALCASAVAVLDLRTGKTEVLTTPGKDPVWSPDGRYIAFVRDRQTLSSDFVGGWSDTTEKYRVGGRPGTAASDQIWLIEPPTHRLRYVAQGHWPAWSANSKHLYYDSPQSGKHVYCAAAIDQDPPVVRQTFEGLSVFPEISPNEQEIADPRFRWIRILKAQSQTPVATWLAPPFPARGLMCHWRPDGREVSITGYHGSSLGAWIFDTRTQEARRMLDGPITQARWSPDGSKMAIGLGLPYWEIWVAELDPNRPTAEAFGATRTVEEHCREQIEHYSRGIMIDPNCLDAHLRRTDAALWIDDSRADEYLKELEAAFRRTPYHAEGCGARARAILSSPPEVRDRLAPLASLLARAAVAKDPDNPTYAKLQAALEAADK